MQMALSLVVYLIRGRGSNENRKETCAVQAVILQLSKNLKNVKDKKKSRMLEVHINICPSGFVDKCSTAIISTLSSTDCKGGNIETNETNPRDYLKDPPVDFDNDIEPTSQCARTDLNKRFLPKPMTTTG